MQFGGLCSFLSLSVYRMRSHPLFCTGCLAPSIVRTTYVLTVYAVLYVCMFMFIVKGVRNCKPSPCSLAKERGFAQVCGHSCSSVAPDIAPQAFTPNLCKIFMFIPPFFFLGGGRGEGGREKRARQCIDMVSKFSRSHLPDLKNLPFWSSAHFTQIYLLEWEVWSCK